MLEKLKANIPLIVVVIGLAVMLYPAVSNLLAEANATRAVESYEESSILLSDDERSQMLGDARKWNARLAESEGVQPAPEVVPAAMGPEDSSGKELDEEYWELMDPDGTGMMAYISIPKLDLMLPIYHGTSDKVLQAGVGHLKDSSIPIGGLSAHAVLFGHRGLPSAKLFTDLDRVSEGDQFYVHVLGKTNAYEVDRIEVMLPEELEERLGIEEGQDLCTLVTCTPYGINSHRLVITGHRVPYVPEEEQDVIDPDLVLLCLALLVVAAMLIALGIDLVRRDKRKREREKERMRTH